MNEKNCADCTRRKFYQKGYDAGKEDVCKRIIERLEKLQEDYMYPDDDEYVVGQYDGVREALTIVIEESGLKEESLCGLH